MDYRQSPSLAFLLQREVDAELVALHEDKDVSAGEDNSELALRLVESQQCCNIAKRLLLRGEGALNMLKEAEADVKRKVEDAA